VEVKELPHTVSSLLPGSVWYGWWWLPCSNTMSRLLSVDVESAVSSTYFFPHLPLLTSHSISRCIL